MLAILQAYVYGMFTTAKGFAMKKIFVYFINFGYAAAPEFETLDKAKDYAVEKCFECIFTQGRPFSDDCKKLGSWSPIGGFRSY